MALRGDHPAYLARFLRGRFLRWCSAAVGVAVATAAFGAPQALAEIRSLKLHNLHTLEDATIVFKRDGVYDQDGLKALNNFFRDVRDNVPYGMDPHLYDLLYEVYQEGGSDAPMQIVCGYRSPGTNEWLRKTTDGVAENSLHMKGEAIDFFIPGVPLSKLRAIGLRMQAGGVGFYPTSGSPFVHLDTGSVRHWPLMTRQQLLAVFPDGKTIDIPADGDPLPGYKEALAAYKARQAQLTPVTQVASFSQDGQKRGGLFGGFIQTASSGGSSTGTTPAPAVAKPQPVGVAIASYSDNIVPPRPNLAPRQAPTVVAAVIPAPRPATLPASTPITPRAASTPRAEAFASPDFWTSPAVPAALTVAMAGRERRQPGSSLPIAPTAVVATVSVNRVLGADAITSAVIRGDNAGTSAVPVILAYAADSPLPKPAVAPSGKIVDRLPSVATPAAAPAAAPKAAPVAVAPASPPPPLTMTALDTAGLRLWMGSASTRQRTYALMTMPDFAPTTSLMSAASASGAGAFSKAPTTALRTDRFAPAEPAR